MRRKLLLPILLLLLMAAPALAGAFPDVIALPDGFWPEGIVIGEGTTAYTGSLVDGRIYAANLQTGRGEVLVEGPGTPAVGLAYDARSGYLYVAGGTAGDARVYDTDSGTQVAAYAFGGFFVNDVIVTRDAAYFTDSGQAQLYRVALGPAGMPAPGDFTTIPLSGDYQFAPGQFNSNGIVASPDGAWLIVVNSFVGDLYRVDPASGEATAIDLGGASATSGDGLLLVGKSLYVVRNFFNQIVEFELNADYTAATEGRVITDPAFDIPTTADNLGSSIYAVNARFTTPNAPDVEYDIVRVKR